MKLWSCSKWVWVVLAVIGNHAVSYAEVIKEPNLDFKIDHQRMSANDIQVSISFTARDEFRKTLDVPEALKQKLLSEGTSPIVVKSAFVVDVPIDVVNRSDFLVAQNIPKIFPETSFPVGCGASAGILQHPLPDLPGLEDFMTCRFSMHHYDTRHEAPPASENAFSGRDGELGRMDGMTFQNCDEFSHIFRYSVFVNHYYRTPEGKTLVVNYQVLAAKDSTRDMVDMVPFVSFKRAMRDEITRQIEAMRDNFNSFAGGRK